MFWRLQLKSVQTTAEVRTDYTCSLHRLRRGFKFRKRMTYFAFVYLVIKGRLYLNEFRHSPLIIDVKTELQLLLNKFAHTYCSRNAYIKAFSSPRAFCQTRNS